MSSQKDLETSQSPVNVKKPASPSLVLTLAWPWPEGGGAGRGPPFLLVSRGRTDRRRGERSIMLLLTWSAEIPLWAGTPRPSGGWSPRAAPTLRAPI